jgi:hypothetical protein
MVAASQLSSHFLNVPSCSGSILRLQKVVHMTAIFADLDGALYTKILLATCITYTRQHCASEHFRPSTAIITIPSDVSDKLVHASPLLSPSLA